MATKTQIRIVLDEVRKSQGAEAVAAILKQVGAIDADSIDTADYPKVARLCGHGELADGMMTCRNDDDETPLKRESNARKPSAFETVVNSAPDVKSGRNMAAKAIHARPAKTYNVERPGARTPGREMLRSFWSTGHV